MSDTMNDASCGATVLPIPNEAYAGPVLYDANDPAAIFPADPGDSPAQGRAERPRRPDR